MKEAAPASNGELVALVDSLQGGTLNADQQAISHRLRAGLLAVAHRVGDGLTIGAT